MSTADDSFEYKLHRVFHLSLRLIYEGGECLVHRNLLLDEATDDLIYGCADGLEAARHERLQGGRCSLNQTVAYDIAAEEARLDSHIAQFEALMAEHAPKSPVDAGATAGAAASPR